MIVAICVTFVVVCTGTYILFKKKSPDQLQTQARQDAQDVVVEVGKLVQLPEDETPTIATVEDSTKLSNQPFFAQAQQGDRILFYQQAKKVFLYRPSTHKVIDVSTLNVVAPTATATP